MAKDYISIRVSINGFRVIQQTGDDALQRDGKGVYVKAVVSLRDRGGVRLPALADVTRTTVVMGDTNDYPRRVKAGSIDPSTLR